mmetsp:Transcript_77134/g.121812  ORF Transcript_77134/g.121812 Transcript_77134/m.121812 type:complete len:484 (-) Transcript_77134:106-1557(-)|eukprot:CAMPEP_0169080272 /NCGR_PEP_ID=MMETSP1015-20121227/10389_1 /TAXON_ID=342587 /ORGANISM="Karlodinium micrum, Strain CCMP2283" /LENGTH=483 /DNA_ID=CAMNT_0009139983 /DNA_START=55 /DNA_END=1506 /DNA_ORIENTATION=-
MAAAKVTRTLLSTPPEGSRLASSLERGYFAKTFNNFHPIGRGGFGRVVKAWHAIDKQWYAVKLIPLKLRPSETVDDSGKGWCGGDIFNQLVGLRSPSLLRYHRRWTELEEDVFDDSDLNGNEAKAIGDENCDFTMNSKNLYSDTAGTMDFEFVRTERGLLAGSLDTADDKSESLESNMEEIDAQHSERKAYRVVLAIQMECFDGVTLDEWIEKPGIRQGLLAGNFEGALNLFKQLMTGLTELHEKGIVHRDVKPNNVMISKANGRLKIIDLGSSCRVKTDSSPKGSPKPRMLVPPEGNFELVEIGTAGYAPPEQCTIKTHNGGLASPPPSTSGNGAVREADVFSAAIVLIELLLAVVKDGPAWNTGMERATAIEALRAGHGVLETLPAELRTLLGSPMQGWLRQLMVRMLAWDGHVRPSSQEVLSQLQANFFVKERHNPYIGALRHSSPRLCALTEPPSTVQNPYVGFFLDHAPRPFESVVAA